MSEEGSRIVRTARIVVVLLLLPAAAAAGGPAFLSAPGTGGTPASRDAVYCQPPNFGFAANASTPFNSEVADDLPDSLAGRTVSAITLHVTEWSTSSWVDPVGLKIFFYDGKCPPPLEPALVCSFAWSELTVSLESYNPPSGIVYAATATLREEIVVTDQMSLGAQVVIDWALQPYAGFALTTPDEIEGCGELYWDDLEHGAQRWTEFSAVAGFSSDLALCLSDPGTGIDEEEPVTWGRIKTLFR